VNKNDIRILTSNNLYKSLKSLTVSKWENYSDDLCAFDGNCPYAFVRIV